MSRWGWNIKKPLIEVQHSKLERINEESIYKSWCPVCDQGILLLSRPVGIFALNRLERCTLCGQGFWYTDAGVGHEHFIPDQPMHLTETIRAAYAQMVESIPDLPGPMTLWERLLHADQ